MVPAECIYVADGFGGELHAASALGMQAVLIAVPGEASVDPRENERATWTGLRVQALAEILELVPGC